MKKSIQKSINIMVQEAEELAMEIWNNNNHGKGEQLCHMNARIFSIGDYKFLVSYTTLVAFIVDGIGFDIMREKNFWISDNKYCDGYYTNFSRTTARQISRFFELYAKDFFTYRVV